MAYSYENELKNLKTAQQNAAMADLQNTRNATLSNLASEEAKNTANFNAQRNTANAQNKISARNFQEYLASTGRANSGISAQARMQNANNLNTQLNSITGSENAALADINRQRTLANNAYASGLASANANIEANYINNLLQQRQQAAQLAQQEREFNESVRQFNEQMKFNRDQLYSNFRSGGSSRSSGSSSSSSSKSQTTSGATGFTDTSTKNSANDLAAKNQAIAHAAKNGETYVKYVKTKQGGIAEQLWKKVPGSKNDIRVR